MTEKQQILSRAAGRENEEPPNPAKLSDVSDNLTDAIIQITGISQLTYESCTKTCPVCNHPDRQVLEWKYVARESTLTALARSRGIAPMTFLEHLRRVGLWHWAKSKDGMKMVLSRIAEQGAIKSKPRAADAVAAIKLMAQLDGHLQDTPAAAGPRTLIVQLRGMDSATVKALQRDAQDAEDAEIVPEPETEQATDGPDDPIPEVME